MPVPVQQLVRRTSSIDLTEERYASTRAERYSKTRRKECCPGWTRTINPLDQNQMLCQLSHGAVFLQEYRKRIALHSSGGRTRLVGLMDVSWIGTRPRYPSTYEQVVSASSHYVT